MVNGTAIRLPDVARVTSSGFGAARRAVVEARDSGADGVVGVTQAGTPTIMSVGAGL